MQNWREEREYAEIKVVYSCIKCQDMDIPSFQSIAGQLEPQEEETEVSARPWTIKNIYDPDW